MVVTGNELHTAQATGFQALQKGTPVHFVLAQGHRNAQNLAFSVPIDAHGYQNSQMAHLSVFPHLLVVGIQEEVEIFPQRAVAPLLQVCV